MREHVIKALFAVTIGLMALTSDAAFGQGRSPHPTDCRVSITETERLLCFEEQARNLIEDKGRTDLIPSPFQRIDAEELYASPEKYEGKSVELRDIRCRSKYLEAYTCISIYSNVNLLILSKNLVPAQERLIIDSKCQTIKNMLETNCIRNIRIKDITFFSDFLNNNTIRVVVGIESIEIFNP